MNLSAIQLNSGVVPWPQATQSTTSITSDSRKVSAGTVFAAWKGEHSDGHEFIADAVAKGAVAILHEAPLEPELDLPSYRSTNVRRDYADIAYQIAQVKAGALELIGVTGTNGKTTTTQLIAQLLRGLGKRVGTIGTLGAEIDGQVFREGMTTPPAEIVASDLKMMMEAGVKICVMEVSSHALSQDRLFGLQFSAAVWTNLTPEHLDFHGTMEAYADAKARLLNEYCPERSKWVLNQDDKTVARYIEPEALTFGDGTHSEPTLKVVSSTFDKNRTHIKFRLEQELHEVESPLIGAFNVSNLSAALGVLTRLGYPLDGLLSLVPKLVGVPGRMETVSEGSEPLVVVDYAHTPDALSKALTTLKSLPHRNLICIFGCGGDRDQEKRPVMGRLASEHSQLVFITNDNPRTEEPMSIAKMVEEGVEPSAHPHCQIILDRESAIEAGIEEASKDDIVLIAGKGHETYQILGKKVIDFDDRKIARRYLNKKFAN